MSKITTFLFKHHISLLLTLIILTANSGAGAQSIIDSRTPVGVATGAPTGSYALSDIENINLFSGNLNFTLPLQKVGGRGGAQSAIMLPIESHWTNFYFFRDGSGAYYNPTPWQNVNFTGIDSGPGYGPGKLVLRGERANNDIYCPGQGAGNSVYDRRSTLYFGAPGGTEFELRDTLTGGAPRTAGGCNGSQSYASRGTVFVTTDGTSATFVSDTTIYDNYNFTSNLFGYLTMRDGTRYRIDNGLVSWIRDRNGNQLTYTYTNGRVTLIKDSLGRETTFEYRVNDIAPYGLCDRITFKGSGGQPRIIRVSYSLLSNSLANGFSLKPKYELFPPPNPNFDLPGQDHTTNFDTQVVSSVWLPNDGITTRRYRFFYNSYAELARAELPTGGVYEYDWETAPEMYYDINYPEIVRRVKERRVINANTVEQRTVYTYSWPPVGSNGNASVTVDYFDGSQPIPHRISRERHFFYGTPLPISYDFAQGDLYNNPAWTQGKEYQTDSFASDGTTVLRSVMRTWRQRAPVDWWTTTTPVYPAVSICGAACTQANAPANDPRNVETVTRLADTNQVTKTTSINPNNPSDLGFDQFSNQTDVYQYDWGQGAPGQFLRRTHTDYVTDPNYTDYTGAHLRALPLQTWVSGDINGTTKASLTQFEYDNYAGDANHAGLVSRANVSGFDAVNYSSSFTRRGNVTAVTSYGNAGAQTGAVSAYSQYDILGNVVKAIDANGNASTIDYSDRFGAADGEARSNTPPAQLSGQNTFAVPTSGTNALGWVTGYAQVDYFTGASVNTEDLNGVISKTLYNDLLDRPTQAVTAVGTALEMQSNIIYDDANHRVETRSDLNALNDNLLKSESFYDGLGRTVKSRKYEASGGYIESQSIPFVMVQDPETSMWRVGTQQTNPYRPLAGEQPVWTTSLSYPLGGKVITPDGAIVKTENSGNTTTVTDQAGKKRRSVTNALGQLTRVDEPNDAGQLGTIASPNQPTNYAYDALNNLTTVNQGAQTRTFAYNSLSRLTSATNPESGTINYTYDLNGNLTSKTDPRGVQTAYIYDALNRVTNRNYTAPGGLPNYQATPNVSYFYDGANIAGGIANSKGKLTKVASSVSTTEYTEFDILGRVTRSKQITDGVTYGDDTNPMTYTYNLGGAMVEQKYPSGRVVKNVLDNDGDLSIVQSKKNQASGYFNYAKNFTYNAVGAVTSMQLGNGRWESTTFNNRLQPTQIALGTTPGTTDKLKLDFTYGTTANNGNVLSQTITVPTVGSNTGFTAVQTYAYDSLNRLQSADEKPSGWTTCISDPTKCWKQTFTYDRYGNRRFDEANTTMPASFANPAVSNPTVSTSNNRLTSTGWLYDAAGNTTRDGDYRTFTYDAENKQTEVKNSSSVTLGQYWYDGDGKRVKKYVPSTGETTIFVYDSLGRSVAEYSTIVASTQEAKVAYLTNDHLGSPRINTDAVGNVIARHDFMPFGEEIQSGTGGRTTGQSYGGQDNIRQKFTGYERDIESDLDFAEARYYNKNHGRFTSVDPLMASASVGNPQTLNRYAYVGNNPINITDPSGLSWYFNSSIGEAGQYKWYEDNQTPADGYHLVNGSSNHVYYAGEGVGYVALNPLANKFQTFDTQEAATKRVGDIYACPDCQALVNTVADESVKKGTTVAIGAGVAIAVGTGTGLVMAATGAAAGTGITVLGLTEAGTAATATTVAATTTATTAVASQSSSIIGRAITGFTKHGINQAISREGAGVSTRAILNTLRNPSQIIQQVDGTVKILGKDAGVVLNQAGKVITTWARNSASRRIP